MSTTEQLTTAILKSIRSRDVAELEKIMTAHPELLNVRVYALTPLLYAVTMNRAEAVRVLLKHGADTKAIVEDGIHYKKNALQLAKATNCTEIVELLSPTPVATPVTAPPKRAGPLSLQSTDVDWRKETAKAIRPGVEENELGLKKTTIAPTGTVNKPNPTTAYSAPTYSTQTTTPVVQAKPASVTPMQTPVQASNTNEVVNLTFSLPMPPMPSAAASSPAPAFCSNCGAPRNGMFCSNCGTRL